VKDLRPHRQYDVLTKPPTPVVPLVGSQLLEKRRC